MTKRASVFLILAFAICMVASATTIAWKGQSWDVVGDGIAVVNLDGSITLTQNSNTEVDLVLNTMFTMASFSYLDNPGANIDMFQQNISNVHNPRIQDGSAFACCSAISYERYDNGPAVENVVYFDLTPRALGTPHTVSTKLYADGSVDHVFDGVLTQGTFLKTNVGSFGEFEQLLLRLRSVNADHRGQQATFTDFQLGGSPVPEPNSYALMGLGLLGLLLWKNRHKMPKLSIKQCACALMIVLAITAIAVPATATPLNPLVQFSQNGGPAQNVNVTGTPGNWIINDTLVGGLVTITGIFGGADFSNVSVSIASFNASGAPVDNILTILLYFDPKDITGLHASMAVTGSSFGSHVPSVTKGSMTTVGNPGAVDLGANISGLGCTGPAGGSTSCNAAADNTFAPMQLASALTTIKFTVSNWTSDTVSARANFDTAKSEVPEPATLAMLGAGLCALALARKRRQNQLQ